MFKIVHANLNVLDLDKSVAFYKEALDLKIHHTREKASFNIAFLIGKDSDFLLELTWLKDMKRPYNLGDNESHICFAADDFDKAYELHKRMQCICYENKAMGVYFIEDPDGYWLEIKSNK
jgi:lactoylglutathione lyase